jgi:iron complex transport system ATP-binding protein
LSLRARAVVFSHPGRPILHGIDLEAREGEICGLLGPNGSGKTTLLRILVGFLRPQAGEVSLAGRAITTYDRRAYAREVALAPQEMPVDFPFTVRELVLLGRTPHLGRLGFEREGDVQAAERAIRSLGIEALADRPIHALSGGELRRAFVARALAQEARVLLADEPTGGLDLHHQVAVFERLRDEARAGRCVVAVVHDLNLASAYCDRLILLSEGRVYAEGTPDALLTPENVRAVYGVELYAGTTAGGGRFLVPMASGLRR